jgi:amino acid permease
MATHQRDDLKDVPPGRAGSAVLFVVCAVLLLASFWSMAYSFEIGSAPLFVVGLAAASASFFVPMQLLGRPD